MERDGGRGVWFSQSYTEQARSLRAMAIGPLKKERKQVSIGLQLYFFFLAFLACTKFFSGRGLDKLDGNQVIPCLISIILLMKHSLESLFLWVFSPLFLPFDNSLYCSVTVLLLFLVVCFYSVLL